MEQTHGVWGERAIIFEDRTMIVTVLFLVAGKRCSWHDHAHNHNLFFVVSGHCGIKTARGYTTILEKKHAFSVEPGVKHEFQTYGEGATVLEISFVRYDKADIRREVVGGDLPKNEWPESERTRAA